MGQPEIRLGVIPGAGGTQRMTWLAGAGVARDLTYTGRQVEADEAKALRLVERVLPADQVLEAAVQDARLFARGPRQALAAAKEAIRARSKRPDRRASAGRRSSSSSCSGAPTSARACGRSSRSDPPTFGSD